MRTVAQAVVTEEYKGRMFANGVDGRVITSSETYRVMHLDVNCRAEGSFLREPTPEEVEAELLLKMSVPVTAGTMLSLASPDNKQTYITIDLATLVPAGWEVRVKRVNTGIPRSLGMVVFQPEHAADISGVHVFTNESLRDKEDLRCEVMSGESFVYRGTTRCAREVGHLGKHQGFSEGEKNGFYQWSGENGEPSIDPAGKFGFKVVCPHCGVVDAGNASGSRVCFTCSYWFDQAKDRKDALVVDGVHYRKGRGGFSGRIWKVVYHNGSQWSGELWYQGKVPSWMRHLFPDTASFAD